MDDIQGSSWINPVVTCVQWSTYVHMHFFLVFKADEFDSLVAGPDATKNLTLAYSNHPRHLFGTHHTTSVLTGL